MMGGLWSATANENSNNLSKEGKAVILSGRLKASRGAAKSTNSLVSTRNRSKKSKAS